VAHVHRGLPAFVVVAQLVVDQAVVPLGSPLVVVHRKVLVADVEDRSTVVRVGLVIDLEQCQIPSGRVVSPMAAFLVPDIELAGTKPAARFDLWRNYFVDSVLPLPAK